MNQLLLVQFVLDSLDNHYVKEVDQEVGGCEKSDPHVRISWGIQTFRRIEEGFVVGTQEKHAVDRTTDCSDRMEH